MLLMIAFACAMLPATSLLQRRDERHLGESLGHMIVHARRATVDASKTRYENTLAIGGSPVNDAVMNVVAEANARAMRREQLAVPANLACSRKYSNPCPDKLLSH